MKYFGREQIDELLSTLGANKLRTALTGFAVGWGILLLVVLLSAGTGIGNGINNIAAGLGTNKERVSLDVGWVGIPHKGLQQWSEPKLQYQDMQFLADAFPEDITLVTAFVRNWGSTFIGNGIKDVRSLCGVEAKYQTVQSLQMLGTGSRFINSRDELESAKVVVVPNNMAESFFGSVSSALGKEVSIDSTVFRVVGVYKTANRWEPAYIPLTTMRLLKLVPWYMGVNELRGIEMICPRVRSQEDCDALRDRIVRALAPRLGTHPEDKDVVYLSSSMVGNQTMQAVLGGIDAFLWIIGLSTLVIGLVGVINIMQITVAERKREIGVRKALGAKPADIIVMILSESVLVTLVSGLIGLSVGVGIMATADYFFEKYNVGSFGTEAFDMQTTLLLHPVINLPTAIGAILVMLIGGVLAGYLPARRAVRIPVVEAMRS